MWLLGVDRRILRLSACAGMEKGERQTFGRDIDSEAGN